jgi:hypothetical protein
MTLSLKRSMIARLDEIFGLNGFVRFSDKFYGHRYDRPFPGGRRSVAVNWHLRKPDLVLDPPYVSVAIVEVQEIVAQFEEESVLVTPADVAQRSTIGLRLDRGEILKTLSGKWAVSHVDDCARVAADYAAQTLRDADLFWSTVATPESILDKLTADPKKVRAFAAPDHSAAERAIVLCKLLHGSDKSQVLARDRLSRLSGSSKEELSAWLSRASSWLNS